MKMSQSPISILQEFLVKSKKAVPIYECIENRLVGLNDHLFTMRVRSGELSAEGKGPTKKDAKTNAAKEMLLQIGRAKPTEVNINNSGTNNPMEIDGPLPLNSESKLNYIGLLHEICAKKSITAPKFEEVNSWGLSHMMNFTIRCEVGEIIEEATATTKKNARADAAKKVWFKISNMRFDSPINKTIEQKIREVGVEVKDLKLDEILPEYSEEHQAAKDKYLNLTKLKPCAFINDRETLENCHNLIASGYSLFLRKSIIAQLSQISDFAQENIHLLPIYKSIVQKVAESMGVELHRIILQRKISTGEFTVAYKLKTKPPIVNICSAKTEYLADFQTIVGIAKDCQIFLS